MIVFTKDSFHIYCNKCHRKIKVYTNNCKIISENVEIIPHGENGMGEEIGTPYFCEINCPNKKCNKTIDVSFTAYEYPIGCFNYVVNTGNGYQLDEQIPVTSVPEFDPEFDPEYYINTCDINEIIGMISCNKKLVYRISPVNFERMVAKLYRDQGFTTELTPETRDGGFDILAKKPNPDPNDASPISVCIECKRYNETLKVGVQLVCKLYGVQSANNIHQSILVTSSYFTSDAINFVNQVNSQSATNTEPKMVLIDYNGLQAMIDQSAKKYHEQQIMDAWYIKHGLI